MAKFVVLTDLHLGQNGVDRQGQFSLLSQIPSSLTSEHAQATNAMARLQRAVAGFAESEPIILIVTGDVLDLSLASLRSSIGLTHNRRTMRERSPQSPF